MNTTIAERLESENPTAMVEDVLRCGGVEAPDKRGYIFPDGSRCRICDNCHLAYFDFGEGCCWPE